MNWLKSHKRTVCLLLAIIGGYVLFLLIPKCTPITETEYSKPIPATKIDSVAKSFKLPEVKPNLIPKKKKVYKKKEPELRKEAENKDIILDIKIVNNHIIEAVIDTSGQVSEQILDIPLVLDGAKEIIIVSEGVQVKEKTKVGKFLQKVAKNGKKVLIVIGGVTVIVVVAVLASGG